jgi:MFS family permease
MSDTSDNATGHLLRTALALFLSYLSVAMALPTTSIFVAHRLQYSNVLGGLAVGLAFVATLLTRNHAGSLTDRTSGKVAMRRGLWIYTAASVLCLGAAFPSLPASAAYAILLAGRALLGLGESLVVVGMMGWGVGLMGAQRSGKVLALVGAAMYGAFAVGGPVGIALMQNVGYAGLMLACTVTPLAGLAITRSVPEIRAVGGRRESFWRVLTRIWRPGAVVGLQGVGFAALGAFISLDFSSHGWPYAGIGLTCFGLGFVAVRFTCGHLPDKIGGTPVAIVSLVVETCGQALLWLAPGPVPALIGALLTGLGCSMVFPSMGSEVIKRVPPQLRGTAVGGFAAFQDIAYGATGPVAGLFADHYGYPIVFLIGMACATLGLLTAIVGQRQTVTA